MGTPSVIGLALAIAIFGVIANHAREMYRDRKYREMFGTLFWATVPLVLFGLFWVYNDHPPIMARNITLGILGAALGAFALVWAGYFISGAADAQTSAPANSGSSGSSVNQQGGITGGTVIINPPAPPRSSNKAAISAIVALIEEGEQIGQTFEATNNADLIKSQYEQWFSKTDQTLRTVLDAGYSAQFRNAPTTSIARQGMSIAGLGYWQHLHGQLPVLNSIIVELRRAEN